MMVESALRERIEANMGLFSGDYQYKSKLFRKVYKEGEVQGREEGREEGRVEQARQALQHVIARRNLTLSPAQQKRIASEVDLARLERWLEAAVSASIPSDIFSDA
ncbi:MAG: hypothetical protein HYZ28_06245 [Myxococcales bacterium]|nr:hypothetical protein [Myxococcales bacterium]